MYGRFQDEDGNEFGSFEVFHFDGKRVAEGDCWADDEGNTLPAGYYWWACFPGCLPDSEFPNGPFETESAAVADARDNG